MTPEEKARQKIDQWFADAGWRVINRDEFEADIYAMAVREGLLKGNLEADYLLYLNGKVAGVFEAKREEIDVTDDAVSEQVERYGNSVTNTYPTHQKPLPFLYKSNGRVLYFRDVRDTDSQYVQISDMHKPHELAKKLNIEDPFAGLPALDRKGLRDCQYDAVLALEKSFRSGQTRALMALATGAGKTFTACLAIYRLLSSTPMRRVLFLVDRTNLAKQAESAFGQFRLTYNGEPFNTVYSVNRLCSNGSLDNSNVIISNIQRLFSFLRGELVNDVEKEDDNEPDVVELPDNPKLPRNYFDLIVVDECHRSIYGKWRRVLEYFSSARFLGLTATPIPETMAFFNNNRIANYTLEQSIVDGVNVDGRIYRIKTEVTTDGGAILEGENVKRVTRYTGEVKDVKNAEARNYTAEELNRSIINPSQIKLILETYRDKVYTEMFVDPPREPNIDYLPKTLIFALNESHAQNIVQIGREVFGKQDDPDFIQTITYRADDSNELIRRFNHDKRFRIAVTCTLGATGTDVPTLEVVIFMRDVQSAPLYVQMKGRGTRTLDDTKFRSVTPNAASKDYFIIVDTVGVTEHEMTMPGPETGPTTPEPTLKQILEEISRGYIPDGHIRRLAGTLARLNKKADHEQKQRFLSLAGVSMQELSRRFYDALEGLGLPPFVSVEEPNLERRGLVSPLANSAEARKYILILAAGFVETLVEADDTLIYTGFSFEEATNTTAAFERYCEEHRDEIEALRIIYNNESLPINYAMLQDLERKLRLENNRFTPSSLWNSYAITQPDKVTRTEGNEAKALTNIIQLVRFAYHQTEQLVSPVRTASQYFNLWLGQNQRNLTDAQKAVMHEIFNYIAANGACTVRDIREHDTTTAARTVQAFGNMQHANETLVSLYHFLILGKAA